MPEPTPEAVIQAARAKWPEATIVHLDLGYYEWRETAGASRRKFRLWAFDDFLYRWSVEAPTLSALLAKLEGRDE